MAFSGQYANREVAHVEIEIGYYNGIAFYLIIAKHR